MVTYHKNLMYFSVIFSALAKLIKEYEYSNSMRYKEDNTGNETHNTKYIVVLCVLVQDMGGWF